jgi:hypothetical protein
MVTKRRPGGATRSRPKKKTPKTTPRRARAFANPFRPGAGHMPPYLAGRDREQREFALHLEQSPILANLVVTGLRGVGKTVLLETFRPIAIEGRWLWVGTDLSEAASLTEANIAVRLLADLSVATSAIVVTEVLERRIGFVRAPERVEVTLDYVTLTALYDQTPGLVADKVKHVLEVVWSAMSKQPSSPRGIVFAYDEAQNLADHADEKEAPLSLLLDVFQSIQKKGLPFMLVLTGLPTLFPKLVEARTFAERMFHVMTLDRLDPDACREAILRPMRKYKSTMLFTESSVKVISKESGGYPYFIQFICREAFDVFLQKIEAGRQPVVPITEIVRKLDTDFFAGRWGRATDRQRELLALAAALPSSDAEFTVQEIVDRSKKTSKPFSNSHVSQMLASLGEAGLVYRNRYGKHSFAVPLLGHFIRRQMPDAPSGSPPPRRSARS